MAEPQRPALPDEEVERRLARLDDLLGRLEQIPGATAALALEAVEALTEVYGEAFARLVGRVAGSSANHAALADDPLLDNLMVLHGLHPDPVGRRVDRALDEVRPYLQSHGGDVALVDIDGDVARVELSGSCDGCASSSTTLELAVRDAVLAAAPELAGVEPVTSARPSAPTLIPVESLLRKPPSAVVP